MIKIENEFLQAEIDETGAALASLIDRTRGTQLLWQGDERSWRERDVVIFPFVGRTVGGFYTDGGREYSMPTHGLCVGRTFEVAARTREALTLVTRWDETTLTRYPYRFRLEVERRLDGKRLITRLRVVNEDDKPIYFGLGGHPGIALPATERPEETDTSGNFLVFDRAVSPDFYELENGCFLTEKRPFGSVKELEVAKELMRRHKTLLLCGDLPSGLLVRKRDGSAVRFTFDDPPVLAFWSDERFGAYVCVEPWWGAPDFAPPVRELRDKSFINPLQRGGIFERGFTISID